MLKVNVSEVQKMQDEIDQLEGWRHENDALCRDFVFDDFVQAFSFMTQVAFLAEKMDHHPNWVNIYNRVSIQLTSHDADNTVSIKDIRLAKMINEAID